MTNETELQKSNETTTTPTVDQKGTETPKTETTKVESPKPTPIEVKSQPAAPTVKEVSKPAAVGFNDLVERINKSNSTAQKKLLADLEAYKKEMLPGKPVNGDQGARMQHRLIKTIEHIIEREPAEFTKLWNILLAFAEFNKDGVFHDRYIYRFSEYWVWNESSLTLFQHLIHIIKVTCNPNQRASGLSQIDLTRSLEIGLSEEGKQRIVTFYKG